MTNVKRADLLRDIIFTRRGFRRAKIRSAESDLGLAKLRLFSETHFKLLYRLRFFLVRAGDTAGILTSFARVGVNFKNCKSKIELATLRNETVESHASSGNDKIIDRSNSDRGDCPKRGREYSWIFRYGDVEFYRGFCGSSIESFMTV